MTHQEMLDQVSDELRNITIPTKITRWLNLAATEIATQFIFGCLHKYATKNTAAGVPDVALEADFLWMKSVEIPAEQTKLFPYDEALLSNETPNYRTQQGSEEYYYINGLNMGIYQVPSGVKVLTYSYQKRPSVMTYPAIYYNCDLPEEWHLLVVQKALAYGYRYEGNTEGINDCRVEQKRLLVELGASAYKRPDASVVIGSAKTGGRPPRPRLPSNFPSIRY